MTTASSDKDVPQTLHHYTTAQGLLGILEPVTFSKLWESDMAETSRTRSYSLRATDARYLNDWGELNYAADALADAIDSLLEGLGDSDRVAELGALADNLRARDYTAVEWPEASTHTAYVTCFCEKGDLLGQWQGYAAHGGGYAVEFYADALKQMWAPFHSASHEELSYTTNTMLRKVHYGLENRSEIENAARALVDETSDGYAYPIYQCVSTLAQFKDAAFENEQEWRAINVAPADMMYCEFRATAAGRLVPYSRFLRLQHDSPHEPQLARSAIKSVRIGPGLDQRLRADAVRKLLIQRGFTDTTVELSEITYNP